MSRRIAGALCAAALAGAVAAQDAGVDPGIRIDEVIDLGLRQIYVTVENAGGERVLGLERAAFRVYDDGRPQEIVTFASGDIPFTAVLLIDGSSSMAGERGRAARAGARAFVEGMREHDEAKLMAFSDVLLGATSFLEGPPRGGIGGLVASLARLGSGGGSAVNDYLYAALEELETRQGRRVAVLLSDGEDVHSVLRMSQVLAAARRHQAQVYWVKLWGRLGRGTELFDSWRDPATARRELALLGKLVRQSGGRVLPIAADAEIEPAFQEVLAELRDQYALGYYPDPDYDDGRWRQIRVTVEGRGLRVRTREGYADY